MKASDGRHTARKRPYSSRPKDCGTARASSSRRRRDSIHRRRRVWHRDNRLPTRLSDRRRRGPTRRGDLLRGAIRRVSPSRGASGRCSCRQSRSRPPGAIPPRHRQTPKPPQAFRIRPDSPAKPPPPRHNAFSVSSWPGSRFRPISRRLQDTICPRRAAVNPDNSGGRNGFAPFSTEERIGACVRTSSAVLSATIER